MNWQKPKTHISLGAPVSASLVSCVVLSGCCPCPSLSPARPGSAGIRSPERDSGSVPGGWRKGFWVSRSPHPSPPAWGSRLRMFCLCARPCLYYGLVPWTAYPLQCSCYSHPNHSSQPAHRGKRRLKYEHPNNPSALEITGLWLQQYITVWYFESAQQRCACRQLWHIAGYSPDGCTIN